jgi:hypothetical protein
MSKHPPPPPPPPPCLNCACKPTGTIPALIHTLLLGCAHVHAQTHKDTHTHTHTHIDTGRDPTQTPLFNTTGTVLERSSLSPMCFFVIVTSDRQRMHTSRSSDLMDQKAPGDIGTDWPRLLAVQ